MATTYTNDRNKTVTGFPAPSNYVPSGHLSATVTAYPYALPPPFNYATASVEPTPNGHFYQSPPIRTPIFCRMLTAVSIAFAIVGIIFFAQWFVVKPRIPVFRVDSASVSLLNATDSKLTGTWDITLAVRNPNHKLGVFYDGLDSRIWYGKKYELAKILMPPFMQNCQNEAKFRLQSAVVDDYVRDDVAMDIAAEKAHGSVRFGVTVFASFTFRSGLLHTRENLLKLVCAPVNIRFSPSNSSGTLIGSPVWCSF